MAKTVKQKNRLSGLLDVVTPTAIEFKPKLITWGERLQRVLVITDYPERVDAAWISRAVNLPGVTAVIYTEPTDPYELIKQIKISFGELEARLNNTGNPLTLQRTRDQYEDIKMLLKKIDREQQKIEYFTCVLLVSADDMDTLNLRTRRVESMLAAAGMRARVPIFRQEEGLLSVGPWGLIEDEIKQIGARNMTAETIAAAYPFVYSGLNDGDGLLLGTDKSGGIVLVDFWVRDASRTNSNLTVIGRPGVGKSTVIKKILRGEFARGTRIIVIDPEDEYGELCRNVDGDWIDCAGDPKGRINPLQVRSVPLDDKNDKDRLYSEEVVQRGPLALHFQTLRTFFKLYLRDLTKIEESLLEIALESLYENFQIFWDTDPTTIKNEDWPTLKDLYQLIDAASKQENAREEWQTLALRLRSSAIGADSFLWSGPTTIQANSDFVVLNIKQLLEANEEILRAQFFNILGWAWNEIVSNPEEKILLVVDEAYLLADPEHPQPLAFLRNTSKRIRKREGGLMTIFHNLIDMLDPSVRRYGQALIDNPVYKIIMGQGDKDIEALTKLMTLSEMETQTLADGRRGEAIFVAGNRRLHLKVDVSPEELALFGKAGGR